MQEIKRNPIAGLSKSLLSALDNKLQRFYCNTCEGSKRKGGLLEPSRFPDSHDAIVTACQITVAYLLLYIVVMALQIITKKRLLRRHKAQQRNNPTSIPKRTFERYGHPDMLTADRTLANFLEWTPVFLGLLWVLAALNGSGYKGSMAFHAAWGYIVCRILYVILAYSGGISADGKQSSLYAATYPAYVCLFVLLGEAFRSLLQ